MPLIFTAPETTQLALFDFDRYLGLNNMWAKACYDYLAAYNYNGIGFMPDFTYNVPNTNGAVYIQYKNGAGEIQINGNPYLSCNSSQRIIFVTWIRQFLREGIRTYQETYNV